MKGSRRGRIVRMLEDGKQEAEILAQLAREFPPGTFKTTNEAALRGTKRDLGLIEPKARA
jgi:hypothetical protein